jgi:hypothetical protein
MTDQPANHTAPPAAPPPEPAGERTVKTNALMPKGEGNGLTAIAALLAAEALGRAPKTVRAALVIFDSARVTMEGDTGEAKVTVRFRRVEPLLQSDYPQAEKLVRRALESRNGQAQLPLELETDLELAFGGLSFDTPPDPDAPDTEPDPGDPDTEEPDGDDEGDGPADPF